MPFWSGGISFSVKFQTLLQFLFLHTPRWEIDSENKQVCNLFNTWEAFHVFSLFIVWIVTSRSIIYILIKKYVVLERAHK